MKKFTLKEDTIINKFTEKGLVRYPIKKGTILMSNGVEDENGGVLCTLKINGFKTEIILNINELVPFSCTK